MGRSIPAVSMSKLVIESDVERVVNTYLDQFETTRFRYELDGASVTLQTKCFDNGRGALEARAARAPWSAIKRGVATEVTGGSLLRLHVQGERDVFFDPSTKQIVRPATHALRLALGGAGQAPGTWSDALDHLRQTLRYLAQTFEGRDVTFALDETLHDRIFAPERTRRAVTVSSNAEPKLRVTFHPNPATLRFEVVDPASPIIWEGQGTLGKRLTLLFHGATIDPAIERKLKKHRKMLEPAAS